MLTPMRVIKTELMGLMPTTTREHTLMDHTETAILLVNSVGRVAEGTSAVLWADV
jgi:hypothetical protein